MAEPSVKLSTLISVGLVHGGLDMSAASGFKVNFTAPNTDNQDGGSQILDRIVAQISTAFKRLERLVGLPNGIVPLDSNGQIDASYLANAASLALTPSTLHVTGTAAANTAVTVTLPAVVGKSHFITSIQLVRVATVALVGGAAIVHTSTNLPGNPTLDSGHCI